MRPCYYITVNLLILKFFQEWYLLSINMANTEKWVIPAFCRNLHQSNVSLGVVLIPVLKKKRKAACLTGPYVAEVCLLKSCPKKTYFSQAHWILYTAVHTSSFPLPNNFRLPAQSFYSNQIEMELKISHNHTMYEPL